MTIGTGHTIGYLLAIGTLFCLTVYFSALARRRRIRRLYQDKHQAYDSLLGRYNPYYRSLSDAQRQRF
ncbi:MAG TPA: hypothetical protein VHE54_08955, partial [Puia sp.]|nr:hypothetical protein [Puia sp.]